MSIAITCLDDHHHYIPLGILPLDGLHPADSDPFPSPLPHHILPRSGSSSLHNSAPAVDPPSLPGPCPLCHSVLLDPLYLLCHLKVKRASWLLIHVLTNQSCNVNITLQTRKVYKSIQEPVTRFFFLKCKRLGYGPWCYIQVLVHVSRNKSVLSNFTYNRSYQHMNRGSCLFISHGVYRWRKNFEATSFLNVINKRLTYFVAFDLEVDLPVFEKRASLVGAVLVPRLCHPYQEPGGKSNICIYT